VLYGALMLATLPTTLGASGQIIWEPRVMRALRKAIRPQLIQADEYIHAFYRGNLKKEEAIDKIRLLGIPDKEIDFLFSLSEAMPGVQDIITMAVREAFSPAIAAKFGQYEEGAERYLNAKKYLDAQGMSQETFMLFWAAHWRLPSTEQGFEMLHRGIISEEELKMLLVASDVMPFWRDKIINMSYAPYTRVDVRRMHQLGILKDSDLLRTYKDIGYDEQHAQNLADWTVQYNDKVEQTEESREKKRLEKNKDLTVGYVIKDYKIGNISQTDAKSMITTMGYDNSEAEFMLGIADYEVEKDKSDKYIDIYQDYFLKGIDTEAQTTEKLGKLNLHSSYSDYLIKLWKLQKSSRTQLPSRADILSWYKKKQITIDVARTELQQLGYQDKYIELYLKASEPVEEE
jgi:hypothetical protein